MRIWRSQRQAVAQEARPQPTSPLVPEMNAADPHDYSVRDSSGHDVSAADEGRSFGFQLIERTAEEQQRIVQRIFDQEINPAVAAHGGRFALTEVRESVVYVRMEGGCQGCSMASLTLREGVERRLRQALPELVALVDTTNHTAGRNPFYIAGKS